MRIRDVRVAKETQGAWQSEKKGATKQEREEEE